MTLRDLLRSSVPVGRVVWIGARPGPGAPMVALDEVELLADRGVAGDRAATRRGKKRQVSLLQAEHLPAIAALSGHAVSPAQCRRNLVVEGINLASLRKATFGIGEAILVERGPCHPCSKMDRTIGPGAFQAMRGHGGILAQVLTGATIRMGAPVRLLDVSVANP